MHSVKSNFDKIFQTIKSLKLNCFDENTPKQGTPLLFTDLQVVSLVLTAECMSLDSENWLFNKIKSDYSSDFPNLTDRTRHPLAERNKGTIKLIQDVKIMQINTVMNTC